jgi:glycogen debranching enzyme
VPVYQSGAFEFYTTYTPLPKFTTGPAEKPEPTSTKTYYIDVAPSLHVGKSKLPLDAISVISVLSKFMGKYPEDWERHLHGISARGYNMVHFTPLMIRGDSNSPYSLYDQLAFDPAYFPNGEADITALTTKMEKDYGLLSMTDVVWNHTANNSKWLEAHPDAGYNLKTAPHLRAPYELDTNLLEYSASLASRGLPTHLANEGDLQRIIDDMENNVIKKMKFWEFYICDVEKDAKAATEAWKQHNFDAGLSIPEDFSSWNLKQKADWLVANAFSGTDRMGDRFHRKLIPARGASVVQKLFGDFNSKSYDTSDERSAYGTIHRFLNEVNLYWYRECNADIAAIKDQILNRAKYMRLDPNGPKTGDITLENPLIESYFTRLPKNDVTSIRLRLQTTVGSGLPMS